LKDTKALDLYSSCGIVYLRVERWVDKKREVSYFVSKRSLISRLRNLFYCGDAGGQPAKYRQKNFSEPEDLVEAIGQHIQRVVSVCFSGISFFIFLKALLLSVLRVEA